MYLTNHRACTFHMYKGYRRRSKLYARRLESENSSSPMDPQATPNECKEQETYKKEVVYRIPCQDCDVSYIGETGRSLQKRLSEHKYAVKNNDRKNGMAVHAWDMDHRSTQLGCNRSIGDRRTLLEKKGPRGHLDPADSTELQPGLWTKPLVRPGHNTSNHSTYPPLIS